MNKKPIHVVPLTEKDLPALVRFCDKEIGFNYYTLDSLRDAFDKSHKWGKTSSFIAYSDSLEESKIVGVRLTFAPGTWMPKSMKGLSPHLWKVAPEHIGCFKSLFIDANYQAQGLGKRLSSMAIDVLKEQGAKAILCHSSLQSPNNSSQRYLKSMGFEPLREHPRYWESIDYYCTHCSQHPCCCSALEMILYL